MDIKLISRIIYAFTALTMLVIAFTLGYTVWHIVTHGGPPPIHIVVEERR